MEQKKKSEITKQKIKEAAEKAFSDNGFAAARVDDISKDAAVNKQLIYAHFGSKEGLYTAVLQEVYSRIYKVEQSFYDKEFIGIETIEEIIDEYFLFLRHNPTFIRLIQWENLENAKHITKVKTTLFEGAKKLLKQGVEKGVLRSDLDIEQMVISLNMFCFSVFSNIHTVSKLMNVDLESEEELTKREKHIKDVILCYIKKVN